MIKAWGVWTFLVLFLLPLNLWASPAPKPPASAFEVALWTVGVIVVMQAGFKFVEWLMQSNGIWKKPESKILEQQQELLAEIQRLRFNLETFLQDWPKSKSHIAELQEYHKTARGERPVWWCAAREEPHLRHDKEMAENQSTLKELLKESIRNEERIITLLKTLVRRTPHLNLEEEL